MFYPGSVGSRAVLGICWLLTLVGLALSLTRSDIGWLVLHRFIQVPFDLLAAGFEYFGLMIVLVFLFGGALLVGLLKFGGKTLEITLPLLLCIALGIAVYYRLQPALGIGLAQFAGWVVAIASFIAIWPVAWRWAAISVLQVISENMISIVQYTLSAPFHHFLE